MKTLDVFKVFDNGCRFPKKVWINSDLIQGKPISPIIKMLFPHTLLKYIEYEEICMDSSLFKLCISKLNYFEQIQLKWRFLMVKERALYLLILKNNRYFMTFFNNRMKYIDFSIQILILKKKGILLRFWQWNEESKILQIFIFQ